MNTKTMATLTVNVSRRLILKSWTKRKVALNLLNRLIRRGGGGGGGTCIVPV